MKLHAGPAKLKAPVKKNPNFAYKPKGMGTIGSAGSGTIGPAAGNAGFAANPTGAVPGQRGAATPPVATPTDAAYESSVNALQTRLNNTNTGLTGEESQIKQSYGFDPEYASNPYTKANMLARAAQQRFTGSTNAMAARGQLYSGALSNARAADQFTSDAQMNDARNSYAQALTDIENRRLGAQTDFAVGKSDAYTGLLGRLTDSTPDASLQPTPNYPNDYPTYTPKPKKPKKKGNKK